MWVITREVNQYDQEGEYFVAAYTTKPTFQQLKALINQDDAVVGRLTRGGGRQGVEDEWWNLHEIAEGEEI